MKVRNFIISNTRDQNNFFELFKTEDPSMGCVTRVFEPFVLVENEYEPVQLNSVDLPVEIVSIILEKLFENYLEDQEIGLACKLAYVSKLYFYNFYSHHVGKPPLGYKHLQVAIYRYCKTFKTMLLLLDASQCELPYDEGRNVCYSLNYSKGVTMCDGSTFAPYNFSDTEIEVTNCFTDMILANDRHSHLKPFTNGTSVYDTVWMVGAGFEGIYSAIEVYRPCIIINLCNRMYSVIPKLEWFKNNQSFKLWNDMLKIVYGPESKIFFVVGYMITARNSFFDGGKVIFSFD